MTVKKIKYEISVELSVSGPPELKIYFYQMHVCLFKAALERKLLSQFPPNSQHTYQQGLYRCTPILQDKNGREGFMPSAKSRSGIHVCCFYFNISNHHRINLNYHFFVRKHMKRLVPAPGMYHFFVIGTVPIQCNMMRKY